MSELAQRLGGHDATPESLATLHAITRDGSSYLAWRGADRHARCAALRATGASLAVGRGEAMDVVLTGDPTVSTLHAELVQLGGQWVVSDGGLSRNGTVVNDEPVAVRRRLRDGDRLRFGALDVTFHDAPPRPAEGDEATAGRGPAPAPLDRVLRALAQPLAANPDGLPATNTEIALALGISLGAARRAIVELCAWHGIHDIDPAAARGRLAAISTPASTTHAPRTAAR